MTAPAFMTGLDFITQKPIASPHSAKTHARVPSLTELDVIELPSYGLVHEPCQLPAQANEATAHSETNKGGPELEASRPTTPTGADATGIVPSFWYYMNKWRVVAACLTYMSNGINDGAPGALIPYMETQYDIDHAIVSLIFVTNAAGFILSAFLNDAIVTRLGRARSLMAAEVIMTMSYVIIACTPPFPAVVVAYLFLEIGYALTLSLFNVFTANLANAATILGTMSGCYGVGGTIAPIVATTMVSAGISWSRFFITTIGLRIACFVLSEWSFWNYEREGIAQFSNSLQEVASRQSPTIHEPTKMQLLGRALRNRTTLFGAFFIFAYQGAEVSESGWSISFLISYRHGDPAKVGYVTAGFWAGITLGRFLLTHFGPRVGEKKFVFGLGAGCICLQVLTWFVPNVVGPSVFVAVLGFLLGPVYPSALAIFTRLLPGSIQMMAISFICSAGSSGGAVVPFTTGILVQAAGTFVLHPVCIAFLAIMLESWAALPHVRRRAE